jgi:hypothetical protein
MNTKSSNTKQSRREIILENARPRMRELERDSNREQEYMDRYA